MALVDRIISQTRYMVIINICVEKAPRVAARRQPTASSEFDWQILFDYSAQPATFNLIPMASCVVRVRLASTLLIAMQEAVFLHRFCDQIAQIKADTSDERRRVGI